MTPYVAMAAGAFLSLSAFTANTHTLASLIVHRAITGLIGFVLLAWGLFTSGVLV